MLSFIRVSIGSQAKWHVPLIPALQRQRQAGIHKFEPSLVYIVSFWTSRATEQEPVLETNKKQKMKQTNEQKYLRWPWHVFTTMECWLTHGSIVIWLLGTRDYWTYSYKHLRNSLSLIWAFVCLLDIIYWSSIFYYCWLSVNVLNCWAISLAPQDEV